MPQPRDWKATGGRLCGEDMQYYMESFEEHFLNGKIRYHTEVLKIQRAVKKNGKAASSTAPLQWLISVQDKKTGACSELKYDRVVLCSGVSVESYVCGAQS